MIVGFTGKLGSGKDTAATRLAALVDLPVKRISFADKLKDSASALLGVPREVLESNKNNPDARIWLTIGYQDTEGFPGIEEPYGVVSLTIREYLQRYGTESHRDVFGDNFWVDQALPEPYSPEGDWHPSLAYKDKLYVITDVRFPNELARVHHLGGIVVRVAGLNDSESTHASEQVLDGVDWEIDNTLRGDGFSWLDSQLLHMLRINFPAASVNPTTSGVSELEVTTRTVTMGAERIRT